MPPAPLSRLMPAMRYRALAAAVDWLCATFGLEKHRVVTADDGRVVFAQLTFGPNMILLGPVADSEIDAFMKQPDEVGGAETQSCYLVVEDIAAHRARAEAAGAEIVVDLRDFAYGGRGYSCRDPEGHIWNFGTYVPGEIPLTTSSSRRRAVAVSSLAVALLGIGIASWASIASRPSEPNPVKPAAADRNSTDTSTSMVRAPVSVAGTGGSGPARSDAQISSRTVVAMAAAQTHEEKRQRRRQAAARAALRTVQMKISRLERARDHADGARQQAEDQLQQQSMARARAEAIARGAQQQLVTERAAKEKAERLAQELREQMKQAQMVPPPIAKKASTAKVQNKAPKSRARAPDQAADSMPGFIP